MAASKTIEQHVMQIEAKLKMLEKEREDLQRRSAQIASECQQLLGAKEAFAISARIVKEEAPQASAPFAFDVQSPDAAAAAKEEAGKTEEPAAAKKRKKDKATETATDKADEPAPKPRATRGRKKKVTLVEAPKSEAEA